MLRMIVVLLLAGAFLLSACQAAAPSEVQGEKVQVAGGSYTDVSVTELQSMLKNKDFTFVNVHIPYAGDIPQTDLSIPYNEIDQRLGQLPVNKNARIVLYCQSDRMSTIASETLVGLGYTNVYNLDGGMAAWDRAGLKLDYK